jgi:tRNA (guanine-N7-)-methyltransferase
LTDPVDNPRAVRSFVRREGRLTAGQQRALDRLWPQYGLDAGSQPFDLDAVFGRTAPRVLEIGFGMGDSLAAIAKTHPEWDFIGIEVHRPGVGRLLGTIDGDGLTNVRVMCADAVDVLQQQVPEASLDAILLFFPDPWHKTRHHKRRLVQPAFVQLLRSRLKPGGRFHMATDWQPYARHALTVLTAAEGLQNVALDAGYVARPDYRPVTKFEKRGERLGHGVFDLMFTRVD